MHHPNITTPIQNRNANQILQNLANYPSNSAYQINAESKVLKYNYHIYTKQHKPQSIKHNLQLP